MVIEAQGQMVCPGFIDVHSHDDLAVLHDHELPYKLLQGVTTTIVGNCGHSVAPVPTDDELRDSLRAYVEPVLGHWDGDASFGYRDIPEYYEVIRSAQQSVNVGALVGHGLLRINVMGFSDRQAAADEIREMQRLLREALEAGALGLSLGLMYTPGCFAHRDELLALAQTVQSYGGVVTSHIRGEGDLLLPSIEEMLSIARESGVAMHISHLKAVGRNNWGTVDRAIQLIRDARSKGLDVTCDGYPYAAGSTTLLSLLPPSALQGGVRGVLERLADPAARRQVHAQLQAQGDGWDNVAYITGWDRVVLTSSPVAKQYERKSIEEIAQILDCAATEAYFRVIEANDGIGTVVIHHMDEGDVESVMSFEYATVGSDGLPSRMGHPHPRLYGTFPRFISKYVRDEGVMSLERGIQKITEFPASRFRLGKRGRIMPEYVADIVILDLEQFSDTATYTDPKRYPTGLSTVLIGGEVAVANGRITDRHPGEFIRRASEE